jgi:hypothetical protein
MPTFNPAYLLRDPFRIAGGLGDMRKSAPLLARIDGRRPLHTFHPTR